LTTESRSPEKNSDVCESDVSDGVQVTVLFW